MELYDLVIYHKNCPDGVTSAWVYWHYLTERIIGSFNNLFVPMDAGKCPTHVDMTNKRILMMDVCPTRAETLDILRKCKSLMIIDHHISGKRELENLKYITKAN